MAKKKKPKLGSGEKFAALKRKLMGQGYDSEAASAIAASVGRKKYGGKKMQKWAKAGKNRKK